MRKTFINRLPLAFRNKYRNVYNEIKLECLIILGIIARIFHRPELPENFNGSKNIHLGCGNVNHPAFINVDGVPAPHIHYVSKIDKLSQFADNSVDLIYACHCLEHFSHGQVPLILKEWRRVLKKGGVLRVSVPDFDSMVELYLTAGRDIQYVLEPITGGQDYKYNYHKVIFNKEYLGKLFIEAGFTETQTWIPGSGEMTTFNDWSGKVISFDDKTFPVSLNIEAIK